MDREEMIERFARFLREYVDDEGSPVYLNKLKDLLTVIPRRSLPIDWSHLNSYDPELADELLVNPEEAILAAEDAVQIVLREPPLLKEEEFKVHARFYNLPHSLLVKELGSEHINRLIQVEGIITRVSEVKPFVEKAVFVCKDCGNEMVRLQRPYDNLVKPAKCDACGSRNINLDVEKSRFINFQSFRLQDRPESLKGGQMPRFIDAILLDDLVDTALPGDRILVTGILRVILEQKDKRPVFKKVLEVNHIEQLSKEIEELEISPEDEQKIRELARRKDVVDAIVDSIAPAIWGMKNVKKGIALALFGGVQRTLPDGTKLRGESHVLLVGDPGVAKSQILRYVANLAPRAIYTSGKSSSAAGLTAAAVRDELTGSWVLEAGVLVLADGGFAMIDEFDKMSDRDRSAIHEALEQQSYHHDFELLLADGGKVKIGDLVDSLIERNRERVIRSKDTEILPVEDVELLAYDIKERKVVRVRADRVSRHRAPDHFIRIRFYNGRSITVTPEHPVMVWENGGIFEKPAEKVENGDIALGVQRYPIELGAPKERTFKSRKDAEDCQDALYSTGIPSKILRNSVYYTVKETERTFPAELARKLLKAGRGLMFKVPEGLKVSPSATLLSESKLRKLLESLGRHVETVERLAIEDPIEAAGYIRKSRITQRYPMAYQTFKNKLKRKDPLALSIVQSEVARAATEIRAAMDGVREAMKGNINFLRVSRTEKVPNNSQEWVYDVTVEPHHLFVSHGLVLHNTISISKAGITATLNSRTTVIAAANPKYGRFNRHKSLPEQLDLPPTLLSRFDLIFLLLDEPDEKVDSSIAEHILKVRRGEAEAVTPKISYDLLKKYIAYARKNIHPVLSREAMEEIKNYYVRMRRGFKRSGEEEGVQPIPITARQLEALIRLSEAHARMRLSETVTREDAREAIRIIEDMIKTIATDEEGTLDVSILEVGKSSKKINKMDKLLDIIKALEDEDEFGAPVDNILEEAGKYGIKKAEARKMLEELSANSRIYEPRAGFYRVL